MNRKGFISTAVVYAFFLLFLILCLSLLSTYNHYRKTLTVEKNDIKSSLKLNNKILYKKILKDNGGTASIVAKGKPDFTTVATTNEGMYSTADDYGTSYYFRGAVDNNWVYFAGIYWRIIRINGDNSVRMIYSGTTAPIESEAVVMTGEKTQIGKGPYSNLTGSNMNPDYPEFVGYKFTYNISNGNDNDSYIKQTLENWFSINLSSYSTYINDSVYCNDRNYVNTFHVEGMVGYTYTGVGTRGIFSYPCVSADGSSCTVLAHPSTCYAPFDREYLSTPILTCNINDAFTVSDITHGNTKSKYPLGTITTDEAIMAGYSWQKQNTSNYLNTNVDYWTMSPEQFYGYSQDMSSLGYGFAEVSAIRSSGNVSGSIVNRYEDYSNVIYLGYRPVISLKSTVTATGTGTWNDPYIVEE
jgi:hypothetical protein